MRFTHFGGAGGEVTGSGLLVQTSSATVLVDFGMFQGSREKGDWNRVPRELPVGKIQAVVLTHAHLDHCGRLALLAKAGCRAPVYATAATLELADLVLRDAAKIEAFRVRGQASANAAKKLRSSGRQPVQPLFDAGDVAKVQRLGRPVRYGKPVEIAPGVRMRLTDAGHLLGSASVELTVEEEGRTQVVVVSGDLGQRGAPLHTDPAPFQRADVVFMETTYGGHDHKPLGETAAQVREIVGRTIAAGGRVLVPCFALGRTQQLVYLLAGAFRRGALPRFPVYLDSPMGAEATMIYKGHKELFDDEARAMFDSGELHNNLRTARIVKSAAESRLLARSGGPYLVLAGSGMANAGRIRGHLKTGLPDPKTSILIVGFQAEGTLGRALVEGAGEVDIDGEAVPVRAPVHTVGGLSAHGGQSDLLGWLRTMCGSRPRVFLTHGEDGPRRAMAALVKERLGLEAEMAALNQEVVH